MKLKSTARVITPGLRLEAAQDGRKMGCVGYVKELMDVNFAEEYLSDDQVKVIRELRDWLKTSEALENEFGEGSLIDLKNRSVRLWIDEGMISRESISASKAYSKHLKTMQRQSEHA